MAGSWSNPFVFFFPFLVLLKQKRECFSCAAVPVTRRPNPGEGVSPRGLGGVVPGEVPAVQSIPPQPTGYYQPPRWA